MKYFIYYICILVLWAGQNYSQSLFNEFNQEKISADEIIAKVGSNQITAEEFFYSYEFGPSFPKKDPNSKTIHLKYMIQEKLLAMEAMDTGQLNKETINNVYSDIVGDLATEELFKDEIIEHIKVDSSEIKNAIEEKLIEVELKWLFTESKYEAEQYYKLLNSGIVFDSLFNDQINDTVFADQRSLKSSLFELRKKNLNLYNLYSSLKLTRYSQPLFVDGGWYIISLINQTKSLLQTQSDYEQNYKKSLDALSKIKMDSLSDIYVHNLMLESNPIIKRETFTILRSYIGRFILDSNTFNDWNLLEREEQALNKIGNRETNKYNDLVLVEATSNNYTLENFINWYRNRELHLKFNKNNLMTFSKSLENMVWRMVRDKLLITEAEEKQYLKNTWVQKQSSWWKDKITFSVFKNELINSFNLEGKEINIDDESNLDKQYDVKLNQKIFQALQSAKKKYSVTINNRALENVSVSTENNRKAIDLYIAKNGGLIPRPAYPSIDNEWATWQ